MCVSKERVPLKVLGVRERGHTLSHSAGGKLLSPSVGFQFAYPAVRHCLLFLLRLLELRGNERISSSELLLLCSLDLMSADSVDTLFLGFVVVSELNIRGAEPPGARL